MTENEVNRIEQLRQHICSYDEREDGCPVCLDMDCLVSSEPDFCGVEGLRWQSPGMLKQKMTRKVGGRDDG